MFSRPMKTQLPVSTNNYGTAQEQKIVLSQPSWPPTVDTNQQTQSYGQQPPTSYVPQQTQSYGQQPPTSYVPQQTQFTFIPPQPMRSFNRVFQPEPPRNFDTQSASSPYRR
jgi:hypothetical protein